MQGGDGAGEVCATCERVPREGSWGVAVGRLVRLGLAFCGTTTTHLACGVWLAWTVLLVRPVRDRLFSCVGCASVLMRRSWHDREARLYCFESAPCLHWQACCMEFSSFFLLFIACGLLWHVLLSWESCVGEPQLYRHLLEHTSTGDICVYMSSSTQAAGRMPWVHTQQGRHVQERSTGRDIGGASRSQSRQVSACTKGAKGAIKQLGGRGAAQNKEEIEQCSAEQLANRRYGRGLHAPCALRGSHPQGVAVAQPQRAVQPSLRASEGKRYLVCPSASAPPDTAQAARPPAVRKASAEDPPANNSTMDRKLRRPSEDHVRGRPAASAKHTHAPPKMQPTGLVLVLQVPFERYTPPPSSHRCYPSQRDNSLRTDTACRTLSEQAE